MRISNRRWRVLTAVVLGLGAGWCGAAAVSGQDAAKKDAGVQKFMRQKLDACSQILEGITTEDAALVKAGANTLATMSAAEKWRVSNDVMYKQFSEEFQRTANKLTAAADKGNFDDMTLKWIDATLSCVECHKFVRGMRLADRK
jgi:cytochrome c556